MDYNYDISQYARGLEAMPYNTEVDTAVATGFGAAFGAFAGIVLVISLAISILQIIAMWKLFNKAGEKGWKSIIPIYNVIVLFKISGISPWLILVFLASIIPVIGWLAIAALYIYQSHNLAKSFGKDIGYTIGLLLLPTIFYMILGFGKSQYVGKTNNSQVV